MKSARIVSLVVAGLLLLAFQAGAEGPKPFTAKELNKFIADYPALAAHMEAAGEALRNAQQPETWENVQVTSGMISFLQTRGWDPERFFYVTSHVAAGLVVVTLEEQAPELDDRLAEARAEIMGNPYLSAELKQQLLDQMGQSVAEMKKLDRTGKEIPREELQLIRKNKERILKAFESP